MRVVVRIVVLVAVFVLAALSAVRGVLAHASSGTPPAQVHLAAAMAGLFAGGAAAVLALVLLLAGPRR